MTTRTRTNGTAKVGRHDYEVRNLNVALEQLKALPALAKIGTPEAVDYDAWDKQHKAIQEIIAHATIIALLSLPAEVAAIWDQISEQQNRLYNISSLNGHRSPFVEEDE